MENKDTGKLYKQLIKESVGIIFDNLNSENPTLKYQSAKALLYLSEGDGQKLYPHFQKFVELFGSSNNILKWTGILVIGNLSKVDYENKISKTIDKLFGFLSGGELITANNSIKALTKIAKFKPKYQDKITEELLKIKSYSYETNECKNIVLGQAIVAFQTYIKLKNNKVINFVKAELKNPRPATAKKAEKFSKTF